MTQEEVNIWEMEHFERIVKWVKDFEEGTIMFVLDHEKNGEHYKFIITKS